MYCIVLHVAEDPVPIPCHPGAAGQEVPVKIVGEIDHELPWMEQVDIMMMVVLHHHMAQKILSRIGEFTWATYLMKLNGLNWKIICAVVFSPIFLFSTWEVDVVAGEVIHAEVLMLPNGMSKVGW